MYRVTWFERELAGATQRLVNVGDEPRASRRKHEDFDTPEEADEFVRELLDEDPRRHPEITPFPSRFDNPETEE